MSMATTWRSQRIGDHDGGQAHAAAAVDRDPLPGGHPALIDDGAERGDKAAAEAGGGGEIDCLRQAHQIDIGVVDGNIFGEGAPMGEAGLKLVIADLVIAGVALRAEPQPLTKGTVTRSPIFQLLTSLPTASTNPASSWPGTWGSLISASWPTQPCQSLRHTPVAMTLTTTACGSGVGSGTVTSFGATEKAS